jgi:hypothetical protein
MPALQTGRVINGTIYSYSSIVIAISGKTRTGVTEISYSDSLEPGELHGTSPYTLGRTRGMYKAEASFTVSKLDFEQIKLDLVALGQGGYGEATFVITVVYRENSAGLLITDTIEGCRVMKEENSHSSGSADALVTKVDLSIDRIRWNGLYKIAPAAVPGGALIGL